MDMFQKWGLGYKIYVIKYFSVKITEAVRYIYSDENQPFKKRKFNRTSAKVAKPPSNGAPDSQQQGQSSLPISGFEVGL